MALKLPAIYVHGIYWSITFRSKSPELTQHWAQYHWCQKWRISKYICIYHKKKTCKYAVCNKWLLFHEALGCHAHWYTSIFNGSLARYVISRVAHAPRMPGMLSPPPRVSDSDMHHGTYVTHVSWCIPGSLTSGFLWSRWRVKRSRHSRRMRNPQFYVYSKRPMQPKYHLRQHGHHATLYSCGFFKL